MICELFKKDDGSLPEIEFSFPGDQVALAAFEHLFACGGRNVTAGGGYLWLRETEVERPFSGPSDAELTVSGVADPFHLTLAGVTTLNRAPGAHDRLPNGPRVGR
jgi:hypothetical protein